MKARCPECDAEVETPDDAVEGEVITCEDCGSDLEVVKPGSPPELRKAELRGEDWGE